MGLSVSVGKMPWEEEKGAVAPLSQVIRRSVTLCGRCRHGNGQTVELNESLASTNGSVAVFGQSGEYVGIRQNCRTRHRVREATGNPIINNHCVTSSNVS